MIKKVQTILSDEPILDLMKDTDIIMVPFTKKFYKRISYKIEEIEEKRNVLFGSKAKEILDEFNTLDFVGKPDFFCFTDNEFFFIELKNNTDNLSMEQKSWILKTDYPVKIVYVLKEGEKHPRLIIEPTSMQQKEKEEIEKVENLFD